MRDYSCPTPDPFQPHSLIDRYLKRYCSRGLPLQRKRFLHITEKLRMVHFQELSQLQTYQGLARPLPPKEGYEPFLSR